MLTQYNFLTNIYFPLYYYYYCCNHSSPLFSNLYTPVQILWISQFNQSNRIDRLFPIDPIFERSSPLPVPFVTSSFVVFRSVFAVVVFSTEHCIFTTNSFQHTSSRTVFMTSMAPLCFFHTFCYPFLLSDETSKTIDF